MIFPDMATYTADRVRFQPASDQSLLIYLGQQISLEFNHQIIKLLRLLESEPIADIRNLHPGYCSLLVTFNGLKVSHDELEGVLRTYLDRIKDVHLPEPRQMDIPVCYGGEYGPDLSDVSAMHGLSPAQIIDLHASATYIVYFLGFVPGFAYLSGLPEALVTPRLTTPRPRVPAGSVGIAGSQTGVYPFASPGGWRLLGRTPINMFRRDRSGMTFLSIGDRVRFIPISRKRFATLENA